MRVAYMEATYFVLDLALAVKFDLLLEDIADAVKLHGLSPVIEGAADKDFICFWVLPAGRGGLVGGAVG